MNLRNEVQKRKMHLATKTSLFLLVFTVIVLAPKTANAGHGSFFKYGLGVFLPDQKSKAEVKMFSVGYQDELYIIDYKLEAGLWADQRGGDRSSSGFGSASLGIEPRLGWFYIHSFWGVALITSPDSMLSTPYQFSQDFGLGVGDTRGVRVGAGYKHLSNAGIKSPNKGRDFMYLSLQIPW